ncbi:MAG: site-specific DNA-methyltransferase [Chloroherpetonaceae bacterium]|nr:site-specific DNA-methyltransferase [bacterium]
MDDQSVNCIVTSPPYWNQRDYGVEGQIGLEQSPEEYIYNLTEIFHECKRVLRDDGTLWCNIGDTYFRYGSGGNNANMISENWKPVYPNTKTYSNLKLKPKDLIGIPWMLAFALRDDGWYFRRDIVWHKTNARPENVKDRCTGSHEFIFFMSKSEKYYYDYEAISEESKYYREPKVKKDAYDKNGHKFKNKRDVWAVPTSSFKGAHSATFPERLIEPCILAGCPEGGIVLDPFMGSGTTALVAIKNNRNFVGIEINPEYIDIANKRLESIDIKLPKIG